MKKDPYKYHTIIIFSGFMVVGLLLFLVVNKIPDLLN